MRLINKVTPLALGLLTLFSAELIFVSPKNILIIVAVDALIWVGLFYSMVWPRLASRFSLIALPLILNFSGMLFMTFLPEGTYRHLFAVLLTFAVWIYFRNLYILLYETSKYRINSFALTTENLSLLTAFLIYTSLFSLKIYVNYSTWLVTIAAGLVSFPLIFQTLWVHDAHKRRGALFSGVGSLVLAQSFLAIAWLPTGYFTNGAAMTSLYYLFVNLIIRHVSGSLDTGNTYKYVLISALGLVAVYLTAAWI